MKKYSYLQIFFFFLALISFIGVLHSILYLDVHPCDPCYNNSHKYTVNLALPLYISSWWNLASKGYYCIMAELPITQCDNVYVIPIDLIILIFVFGSLGIYFHPSSRNS